MKQIQLTRNKVALVDDADFEWLNQFKWYARKHRATYYAERRPRNGRTMRMHRIILGTPDGMFTDHRDQNGLNNQRENLRICTRSQNASNKRPHGSSKYLGVSNTKGRITARIIHAGVDKHLGTFKSEEAAARAYDIAALELHGEFANLNFKQNEDYEIANCKGEHSQPKHPITLDREDKMRGKKD